MNDVVLQILGLAALTRPCRAMDASVCAARRRKSSRLHGSCSFITISASFINAARLHSRRAKAVLHSTADDLFLFSLIKMHADKTANKM